MFLQGTFCTFDMTLRGYEDNIYSFYVYVETTTNTFVTKGGSETLQSTIDERFKLDLPTGCLPKNTSVGMQVYEINNFLIEKVFCFFKYLLN